MCLSFYTGAPHFCTFSLCWVKFDPYLLKCILDPPVSVKSRKKVVLGYWGCEVGGSGGHKTKAPREPFQ